MKLQANSKGKDGEFEQCPAGTHHAVLVGFVDLGTHSGEYQGEANDRHLGMFVWELPGEQMAGYKDRNWVIGAAFTLSLNEKAKLRAFLKAWRGKDFAEGEEFDVGKMLGSKCLLTVVHSEPKKEGGRSYANVAGAAKLPKGMEVPQASRAAFFWEMPERREETGAAMARLASASQDWLPRYYGQPLSEVVADSQEWKELERAEAPRQPVAAAAVAAPAGDAGSDDDTELPF